MREFAILNVNDDMVFSENILKHLGVQDKITVFRTKDYEFDCAGNVEVVKIPDELKDSQPKIRNYISKYYLDRNFRGFLHVLQDDLEILKDPGEFLAGIEEMMKKLKQKSWFSTETDPCNYTFKIFNPRMSVAVDEEPAKSKYDKTVYWTSHANTSWICYDLETATFEDIQFNENFTISMFYIIYFLAQRRNNKKPGELYYMNFYPTIQEERGVFRCIEREEHKTEEEQREEQRKMEQENKTFTEYGINHSPDSVVEQIIEDMFNVLAT